MLYSSDEISSGTLAHTVVLEKYAHSQAMRPDPANDPRLRRLSKRQKLTVLFAGIDRDIQRIFFNLPHRSLEFLFKRYGQLYGKRAEDYARQTYSSWKTGRVLLSGQTSERLLALLPPYLSLSVRYRLIEKLRKHYLPPIHTTISTTHTNWRNDVLPVVTQLIRSSRDFQLPSSLKETATWLSNGDADAANRILASIDHHEAKLRSNYLFSEFARIEALVNCIPYTQRIRHSITLPQGTIDVIVEREKKSLLDRFLGGDQVTNKDTDTLQIDQLKAALDTEHAQGKLLEFRVEDLTNEDKRELLRQILRARVDLAVSQANADQRFRTSTRDMQQTVQTVAELEQSSKSDYEITSSFGTASGQTNLHVKKNNNTVIVVVAIAIAIIVVAFISSL